MGFHSFIIISILTVFINSNVVVLCTKLNYVKEKNFNRTLFIFDDVKNCAKNEYYDLNYFQCSSCKIMGENLQSSKDSK